MRLCELWHAKSRLPCQGSDLPALGSLLQPCNHHVSSLSETRTRELCISTNVISPGLNQSAHVELSEVIACNYTLYARADGRYMREHMSFANGLPIVTELVLQSPRSLSCGVGESDATSIQEDAYLAHHFTNWHAMSRYM